MLRSATPHEACLLGQRHAEERAALLLCRSKAKALGLPMTLLEAEYQFDRKRLTLYFVATKRIDFRELVKDLFAIFKTRIWLEQVSDKTSRVILGESSEDGSCEDTSVGSDKTSGDKYETTKSVAAATSASFDSDENSEQGRSSKQAKSRPRLTDLLTDLERGGRKKKGGKKGALPSPPPPAPPPPAHGLKMGRAALDTSFDSRHARGTATFVQPTRAPKARERHRKKKGGGGNAGAEYTPEYRPSK